MLPVVASRCARELAKRIVSMSASSESIHGCLIHPSGLVSVQMRREDFPMTVLLALSYSVILGLFSSLATLFFVREKQ